MPYRADQSRINVCPGMRITTWNVNGLRSVLNKGAWQWIEDNPGDIVLLQEIKTRPEQLSSQQQAALNHWSIIWNPAVKPGYSGVATLFKASLGVTTIGIGKEEYDCEGRVIRTQIGDLSLFNIYFPHGRHDFSRVPYKLDFYRYLLDRCLEIQGHGGKIILAGDFNTAHKPIDLKNPKANENTSGFLPEERFVIDQYLKSGFIDIYRQQYPDRAQYTWWAYHSNARARGTGWRLDYFLISENLQNQVKEVIIHDNVLGSDHCPVSLEIIYP